MLADVFENFRNMYFKINDLDLACFLTAPQLASQAASKKSRSKIRSFNCHRNVTNGRKKVLGEEFFTLFIYMQKLITNT